MRRQQAVVGSKANRHARIRPARKAAVQIGIQHEHVWLVDGDIPTHRRLAMDIHQAIIQPGDRVPDEDFKEINCFVHEPRIDTQPGGMGEMLERHDRLQAFLSAGGDAQRIGIDRLVVELRRGPTGGGGRRLNPRPLETEAEGIQAKSSREPEILAVSIPEIHSGSGFLNSSGGLAGTPVIFRIPEAVVASLALVARGGDSNKK